MTKRKKILTLFPLTPEEQRALQEKQNADSSVQKNVPVVLPSAQNDSQQDKAHEAPIADDASGKRKLLKRLAALTAIICAMLVGAGITAAMLSNKNDPASGVNAVSGQKESSLSQSYLDDSELPQKNTVKTALSAQHDSYFYEGGVLTIRSDAYFESDHKEYMNLNELKKVKVESGVTVIGSKAFDGCHNLAAIELPDTVIRIGESAFEDCKKLTAITLPETLKNIDGWAFAGCTGLTAIHIPENVEWIGPLAFSKCSALEAVSVDEHNTSFSAADGVLFDKDKTILYKYPPSKANTAYVIPDSVRYIDDHAFCVCNNLLSVTIPEGVLSVGDRGFSSCQNLSSVNIPSSVQRIGVWAFSGCYGISTITIPYGVTSIDHSAFYHWTDSQKIIVTGREAPPDTWHKNWNAACSANILWEK